jgi:1-aminocyclopropane-1-carboxylate deaminase/D-cysteine desulfhydrase-like pyridoxal-dependent ACC family enzyme
MNLDKIREAAERQNKIQRFVTAGTMKATTGAYEMAKLSDEILRAVDEAEEPHPEIVCLCGSTRFYDAFQRMNYELTMQGKIILSVGFYPHSQEQAHGQQIGCTAEQKAALDELHKRKIDLADRVLVLNVGGYIGSSTRSEIDYALAHGKPVDYLESGCGRKIEGGGRG